MQTVMVIEAFCACSPTRDWAETVLPVHPEFGVTVKLMCSAVSVEPAAEPVCPTTLGILTLPVDVRMLTAVPELTLVPADGDDSTTSPSATV